VIAPLALEVHAVLLELGGVSACPGLVSANPFVVVPVSTVQFTYLDLDNGLVNGGLISGVFSSSLVNGGLVSGDN
jgi:hypothetical protein